MKVTYLERIENRTAYSRKMFCPECGGHEYEVIEQLEPFTDNKWYIRCPQCGYDSYQSPTRAVAIGRWKQLAHST